MASVVIMGADRALCETVASVLREVAGLDRVAEWGVGNLEPGWPRLPPFRQADGLVVLGNARRQVNCDVVRAWRAHFTHRPLVFLGSGSSGLDEAREAVAWGATAYLALPFDVEQLGALVGALCGSLVTV